MFCKWSLNASRVFCSKGLGLHLLPPSKKTTVSETQLQSLQKLPSQLGGLSYSYLPSCFRPLKLLAFLLQPKHRCWAHLVQCRHGALQRTGDSLEILLRMIEIVITDCLTRVLQQLLLALMMDATAKTHAHGGTLFSSPGRCMLFCVSGVAAQPATSVTSCEATKQ